METITVDKPNNFHSLEEGPTLEFARRLNDAMIDNRLTIRDVAQRTGHTYEHVRKVLKGGSFPSRWMLKELCRVLNLPEAEMERHVIAARIQVKYGKKVPAFYGNLDRVAEYWPHLSVDQQVGVLKLVESYTRNNGSQKRGVG